MDGAGVDTRGAHEAKDRVTRLAERARLSHRSVTGARQLVPSVQRGPGDGETVEWRPATAGGFQFGARAVHRADEWPLAGRKGAGHRQPVDVAHRIQVEVELGDTTAGDSST